MSQFYLLPKAGLALYYCNVDRTSLAIYTLWWSIMVLYLAVNHPHSTYDSRPISCIVVRDLFVLN